MCLLQLRKATLKAMRRARHSLLSSFTLLALSAMGANAAQPLTISTNEPIYSVPMTQIEGRGAVVFHITFGMLVDARREPVGLYRTYPSRSRTPLSEVYGLGMLGTRAGVVLASKGSVPLLILHGHIGDTAGRDALSLTYVTRLWPRQYATCILDVVDLRGRRWKIVDRAGKQVTRIVIISSDFGITRVSHCPSAP